MQVVNNNLGKLATHPFGNFVHYFMHKVMFIIFTRFRQHFLPRTLLISDEGKSGAMVNFVD